MYKNPSVIPDGAKQHMSQYLMGSKCSCIIKEQLIWAGMVTDVFCEISESRTQVAT